MVAVTTNSSRRKKTPPPLQGWIAVVSGGLVLLVTLWLYGLGALLLVPTASIPGVVVVDPPTCPVSSISHLSPDERHPTKGDRHMVTPPEGGKLTLLCCQTTTGPFSALLHHRWAPLGVARLVAMVQRGYFDTGIPLFRCTNACQFGLSADPNATKLVRDKIQDDPPWLPTGPEHRVTKGVKRYPAGMWTYAGGGNHSRSHQFVITLTPNPFMGGGSPWEVPLGELVHERSFQTIRQWYTGYGEKGPSQKVLRREGYSERVQQEWPLMDSIVSCSVVEELEQPTLIIERVD